MRLPFLVAIAAALASPAGAATLAQLEQEVLRLAASREATRQERARAALEAAPLVEAIARTKEGGPSASRELTRRLRALDRVAGRIDELEGRLRDAERRLAGAVSKLASQAEGEERTLLERARRDGTASVAAELAALAELRRRVTAVAEPPRFRPPLEVSLGPLDGPAEIQAKLRIIDGERSRLAGRQDELVREEALLAARLRSRREWARDLGAARRDAGGEVELLERAHESAESALRDLGERSAAIAAERATLRGWDDTLVGRRLQAEERLRSLVSRGATP